MHDSIMSQAGMETDRRTEYGRNDGWVQIDSYNRQPHQSPVLPQDYSGFQYIQPSNHGLPLESAFSRMQPQLQPSATTQSSHTPLLPLLMPSHQPTWPSMLTNPAGYAPHSMPIHQSTMKTGRLPSLQTSTPRKTLTDDDRRRMCQYHEDHPNTKQVEIGALFGVERSTVSKVLRQKEKYLCPEDRVTSPVKRQKGKSQDIDRALSAWFRKSQEQGVQPTDASIKEKAMLFARTVGNQEGNQKSYSTAWLEKFKQKNGAEKNGSTRRVSEMAVQAIEGGLSGLEAGFISPSTTPYVLSPTSPTGSTSSLSLSLSKSHENVKCEDMRDFEFLNHEYRNTNSHSTTSLSSTHTGMATSSYSGRNGSPETPYTFSPDITGIPFLASQETLSNSNIYQRPRSQTFPNLDIEPSSLTSGQDNEPMTPKFQESIVQQDLDMNNMTQQYEPNPYGTVAQQLQHRASMASVHSIHTPLVGQSPMGGTAPNSPSTDEARAALHTLLGYFSSPQVEDGDAYTTVLNLTQKLDIHNMVSSQEITPIEEMGFDQQHPKMEDM